MLGLLSLPSELLAEIIETCPEPERCCLRATCKLLNEHADPIVFRRLSLYRKKGSPRVNEHQIFALATQSSKACEFTMDLKIDSIPNALQPSEQSRPHFGHCNDLRIYLPMAISKLRNMTTFRWCNLHDVPEWLTMSLIQTVARLPQLTELYIWTVHDCELLLPLGLFTNLSKFSVHHGFHGSLFIPEMATLIANSPQLKSLEVYYTGTSSDGIPLPTLSALFAKIPANNPLCLEHLSVDSIDATVDQMTLPHLRKLTSFDFCVNDEDISIARSVWASLMTHHIDLSHVELDGAITEEAMFYLSSFSGLTGLAVYFDKTMKVEKFDKMLFEMVLPKHAKSLRTLFIANISYPREWVFDHTNSKSIMNCLKLRDLHVQIDGKEDGMSVQRFLDTVAHLPELKKLSFSILTQARMRTLDDFKPKPGLRYVKELKANGSRYVLEQDGEQVARYRCVR